MADRDPRYIWISSTRDQAIELLRALAGEEEPAGFADEFGSSVREAFSSRPKETLQFFDIFVPDELMPPEVLTPSEEDAKEILGWVYDPARKPPSYVGFRPPYCAAPVPPPGGPSYSLVFALVMEGVADRAAGDGPSQASDATS